MIKDSGQQYAVYWKKDDGTEYLSGITDDISKKELETISRELFNGRKYRLESITPEQAKKIKKHEQAKQNYLDNIICM